MSSGCVAVVRLPVPLSEAPEGVELRVVSIDARGWGIVRRLLEIGLTPGTVVKVVSRAPGPIIVEVRGARFALGRGHARRVMVEVLGGARV